MSYLLDTNVVSELTRPRPEPAVVDWFDEVSDDALYLSVLTLGELRKGVELLRPGARREQHLLPVDASVADRWGRLLAMRRRTPSAIDSLIAATALQHDLRLVTRNVADFDFEGLEVVNPWGTLR